MKPFRHGQSKYSEEGYVMLVVMIVMFLLTLIGMVATSESIHEIKMVSNQKTYNEAFFRAESALNLTLRNLRQLDTSNLDQSSRIDKTTGSIVQLLNDTINPEGKDVGYKGICRISDKPIAEVEVRRLFEPTDNGTGTTEENLEANRKVSFLSDHANDVPIMSHRYYDGSMDKKRFAITTTALRDGSATLTWVQKGLSLPAEQNRDIF